MDPRARESAEDPPADLPSAERPSAGKPSAEGAPADPESVARDICLRKLTGAPKTRGQLADALARKDVPDEVAERVLDRLEHAGLVDDAEFAEAWVQSRHAGRGLARRALRSELRKRGVDEETASEALDALSDEDELATARRLVARKLPSTRHLEPAARVRRLAGLLARKGYSSGLTARVVREALEAEGAGEEELAQVPEPESSGADDVAGH